MNSLAFVGVEVSNPLHLDRGTLGACIGIAFLGMVAGAAFFGWLADRIGRKRTLLAAISLFGLGSFATSQVCSAESLLALHFFTGLALGGVYPAAATALLTETAPPALRTIVVGIMSVGAAVCGIVASRIVPQLGGRAIDHYRLMTLQSVEAP